MTKGIVSNWIPWYVDELENKVTCRICETYSQRKNGRMLSHLGYIRSNGERNTKVKLYKNMKPVVACAFQGCYGVAPAPLEPGKLQHLQGRPQREKTNIGTPSSTMHESCCVFQNLVAISRAIWNSLGSALQLLVSTRLSNIYSRQQSTILDFHAKIQQCKHDMAWVEFFYNANIPSIAAQSTSFKKAMKMMLEMKRSYLPPTYRNIRKRYKMIQSTR
jgi:hypothetical protein